MNNHTAFSEMTSQQAIEKAESVQSLSEMAHTLRQVLQKLGNILLHLWLMWLTPRYCSPTATCPHCGQEATYQHKRWGKLITLFGDVRCRRAYYVCSTCPLDERLGLRPNAMSAEVERLAGMVGVQMPFGKGRDVFEELTLIALSDHSLGKAAQAYGTEIDRQEGEWLAEAMDIAHADDFGDMRWATGIQRDAHRALELIFLGDGARWIWDLVSLHFPPCDPDCMSHCNRHS